MIACWICLAHMDNSVHLGLQCGNMVAVGLLRCEGFLRQDPDGCSKNWFSQVFAVGGIEGSAAGARLILKGLVWFSWKMSWCVFVCV